MSISSIHFNPVLANQVFAQLDAAAQAARKGTVRSLESSTRRGGSGRFVPVVMGSENSGAEEAVVAALPAVTARPHTVYTATRKNGRLSAKKQLQTADGFWSCLIDRQL